jgi:hypothetical protein
MSIFRNPILTVTSLIELKKEKMPNYSLVKSAACPQTSILVNDLLTTTLG